MVVRESGSARVSNEVHALKACAPIEINEFEKVNIERLVLFLKAESLIYSCGVSLEENVTERISGHEPNDHSPMMRSPAPKATDDKEFA